jgi:hypothetical protein
LLGLANNELTHEAFDTVVGGGKAKLIDQILEDRHGFALETQLALDIGAAGLAR